MIRRIPVSARAGQDAGPEDPDTPPSLALDEPIGHAGRRPVSPRARRLRRILGWGVLGLVVLAGGLGASGWWYGQHLIDQFHAGDKGRLVDAAQPYLGSDPGAEVALPAPAQSSLKATTFLLIGSDSRGGSAAGGNSDTMILARVNAGDASISLLSVPRDLRVPIPGYGEGKINAAYARGGPALAIRTLRDYLGVRIDHFLVVDFGGFQSVVNDLGGVWVNVDQRYLHRNEPGGEQYAEIDLQPGYQQLDGEHALEFARYRHGDSDYFRQARQHLFLEQVKHGLSQRLSLSGASDLPGLLGHVAKATTSDLDSLGQVIGLLRTVLEVPSDDVFSFNIPGHGAIWSDGRYYLSADQAQVRSVVRHFLDPQGTADEALPSVASDGLSSGGESPIEITPSRERSAPALTVPDGGTGAGLVAEARPAGLETCAPSRVAGDSHWAYDTPVRAYTLKRHPALALVGEIGAGRHYLWMQTSWQDPPLLAGPAQEVTQAGRRMRLHWDGRILRTVSFRVGDTNVWLQNTLRGDLSPATMRELAASCS